MSSPELKLSSNLMDEPFVVKLEADGSAVVPAISIIQDPSSDSKTMTDDLCATSSKENIFCPSVVKECGAVSGGAASFSIGSFIGGVVNCAAAYLHGKGLPASYVETGAVFNGNPAITLGDQEITNTRKLWNRRYGSIGDFEPSLQDFKKELQRHGVSDFQIEDLETEAEEKSLLESYPALRLSVFAYTSTAKTKTGDTVHKSLNIGITKNSEKWKTTSMHLLSALQHLPYEWTTVYRGSSIAGLEDVYEVGNIVMWGSFASTSKNFRVADRFAGYEESSTIYEIEAYCGRHIQKISKFPDEDEVLLPPLTTFRVAEIYMRERETTPGEKIRCVKLEQLHIARGLKCVLWVDDEPKNNKIVMEKVEKAGVCFIMHTTTNDAMTFLKDGCNSYLLKESIDKFRIITDMKRLDDGAAGAKFISKLRNELNYMEKVLVFTGYAPGSIARLKEYGVTKNVIVACKVLEAIDFACFKS